MPVSAVSLPLLPIAPAIVVAELTKMPLNAAEIVPLLLMPPPALVSPKTPTLVTKIPLSPPACTAEITPLLVMPPALPVPNAATLLTFYATPERRRDFAAVADAASEGAGIHENAAVTGRDGAGVRYPAGRAARPKKGVIGNINAAMAGNDPAGTAIDDAAKKGRHPGKVNAGLRRGYRTGVPLSRRRRCCCRIW